MSGAQSAYLSAPSSACGQLRGDSLAFYWLPHHPEHGGSSLPFVNHAVPMDPKISHNRQNTAVFHHRTSTALRFSKTLGLIAASLLGGIVADFSLTHFLLAALGLALIFAAITDLRSRRIANWLNAAIAVGAPLFWWASGLPLWPGVASQLGVALLTFAITAGLFALRAMGGGDVKLLTALALWIPPVLFFKLVILMALLGGILTLAFGVVHIMRRRKTKISIPYGVAISAASLWVIGTNYLPPVTSAAMG